LGKKGLAVWVSSSVTFIAVAHLVDAISATFFGNPIRLLFLYPIPSDKLETITPLTYFWITATISLILWGITCAIAFENPVETFLNKVLSDAKSQSAVENQLLENKSEVLDAIYETMESCSTMIAEVKDTILNVRSEAMEIRPMKESLEKARTELSTLKKEMMRIDEKMTFPIICTACGKPLMPEFNVCPYCGENVKLQHPPLIKLKDYK
jgi:rRNA maturation endonuclease Nob1